MTSVPAPRQGSSPLRDRLEAGQRLTKCTQDDLTVLSHARDPFRLDTPANHRKGAWLAEAITDLGLGGRTIHLRGLHYAVIGRPKPDGNSYTNTDKDWTFLSEIAAKAARWLGYVDFDSIVDQRNAEPVICVRDTPHPSMRWVHSGLTVDLPPVDACLPRVCTTDFQAEQPYRVAMFGEKSSLEPVLGPLAENYGTDLYLPTGEMSDTMVYRMAKAGAADPRPMILLCFSDCDPAGWQMPISISRKLQALEVIRFPGLRCKVYRVALTPDQGREHGLPSTPLKDTERRGDNWRERMGVEQTEIDALASLQPDLLRDIARNALDAFHDRTLTARLHRARWEWQARAQAALDRVLDPARVTELHAETAELLERFSTDLARINHLLEVDPNDVDWPATAVPEVVVTGQYGVPLFDSDWSFVEQSGRLIASKTYTARETAA